MSRDQTLGEEIANAASHGAGVLLAIASLPILLEFGASGAAQVVAAAVFSATMLLLYLVSTLYHALPRGAAKRVFNRLDHAAIFLFIAGSYTPFTLGVLAGAWGWTLFGLVWGLAAVGVMLKAVDGLRHPWLSTGLYIALGWLVLIAAVPLAERISAVGLALLVAGGASYTVGAAFFVLDTKLRYGHFVWHLFVLGGSGCHLLAAAWQAP